MIEETLLEAEEKMEKAVVVAKEDFAAIRTGRAHPAMFNKIVADYYGALTPINQLASFSVPEPRMAVVTPFDKTALRNIEQAIRDSDLGVNPSNDGNIIRVTFPELTRGAPQGVHQGRQDQGRGLQDLDPLRPPQGQGALDKLDQGRRVRRGRGPPRGEGARRHHREVRRAGGRAAQAQGSRAARGLMNDSSWGAPPPPGQPGTGGRPTRDLSRGLPRRVPRTMRMSAPADSAHAHRARRTRRTAETRMTTGGPLGSSGPLFRDETAAAQPIPSGAAESGAHARARSGARRRRRARGVTCGAAIGVGVGLGAVIVASLFIVKAVFVGVIAVAVVVGLWELTSRLQERKGIKAPLVPLAVGGAAMVVAGYVRGAEGAWVAMALTALAVLVWRMTEPPEGYLKDVTAGVFAAFYVPFLATFVAMMLTADDGAVAGADLPAADRGQRHRRVRRRLALRQAQARPAHQPRQDPRGPARRGGLRDGGGRAVHAVPDRRRHLVAGPAARPRGRGQRHARRPRRVDDQAGPRASRTWARCCPATAASWTASTRCCRRRRSCGCCWCCSSASG